ncbi:hypothetical protein RFI_10309 [Reticulomyxa filosa]|uniref:7-dehydrocholesterol reductase n=1 Tax=Reticulomyxa filosa TaxID=46433 RepID=X6NLG1_RETFI|nr:hypothetical protein RFI_10309 [Reticulomyxa filosa]|eukprot:ETO26826.1 hypothetical protein RFI_10309 [Reticulomyxa filosa]
MPHQLPELKFWRHTLGALGLELFAPLITIILAYIVQKCNGLEYDIYNDIRKQANGNIITWISFILRSNFPSPQIMLYVLLYYLFEYALLVFVPGSQYKGPPTPTGYVPLYIKNGNLCYIINIVLFVLAYVFLKDVTSVHLIHDHITSLIISATLYGYLITIYLYFKGIFASYHKPDLEITGNFIYDYYKGLEWYPSIFGVNCKQLVNCRIGMTQWALITLSYALKDFDANGKGDLNYLCTSPVMISALLQIIYLGKFFYWETGYFHTMDVQHDRCGFYITWGMCVCLFFVYTFHTGWLLAQSLQPKYHQQIQLSWTQAVVVMISGIACIYINYASDAQKYYARMKKGECNIWGKPCKMMKAEYIDDTGKVKESYLLYSGYWGLSRHFHYVPEILSSFFWTVPTHYYSIMPYFYVIYLTILLTDRSFRDDERCRNKYGKHWDKYCQLVPYKIIPFLF